MVDLHGDEGRAWLDRLPDLLAECERRWSLRILPPFEPLSYNYVAPAVADDGRAVVVKVGVPHRELLTEMEALRIADGRGMVRLLEADSDQGLMLLERLQPGRPLSELDDDEQATAIAAQVMRRLWRPAPAGGVFPSVGDWAQGFARLRSAYQGGTGPLPSALVDRAERQFAQLLASAAEPVLLHGDLHHFNILSAQREPWLALDPKGVIGEPPYEAGALLRNPWPGLLDRPAPDRLLARRIDQLSELLAFDRERIRGWGMAQAVLSAWWIIEDEGYGWEHAITCAELLAAGWS